jgi:hypothetical protein
MLLRGAIGDRPAARGARERDAGGLTQRQYFIVHQTQMLGAY